MWRKSGVTRRGGRAHSLPAAREWGRGWGQVGGAQSRLEKDVVWVRERGGQEERGVGGMLRSDALNAEWTRPPRRAAAPAPWGWPGAVPMLEPGPQGWRRLR